MIHSRSLDDLNPLVAAKARDLIARCEAEGIDLLVTSTFRDLESQAKLYAQGRTAPGRIVTNARPGQSFHNWRVAFDVVPLHHGKPIWDTSGAHGLLWQQVGSLGESLGLEWAGRWKKFREFPHFQWTGGLTIAEFRTGRLLS